MKRIKLETANRCLFWHRWEEVKNTGLTIYEECKKCKSRKATQKDGGCYQPINHSWVLGETDTI